MGNTPSRHPKAELYPYLVSLLRTNDDLDYLLPSVSDRITFKLKEREEEEELESASGRYID